MKIEWPLARRPFRAQMEALEKGWDKPGFNFYMEQGLGKSLTLLANFEKLRQARKARKLIIVSPNSFKGGWLKEIALAGITTPSFAWKAGQKEKLKSFLDSNAEWVLIINYESLSRLVADKDVLVRIVGPDVMVALDESIKIKNPKTDTSRAALHLSLHCGWYRNLSGKPVTQGPHDLWAQLKFIKFIKKMNYYAFRNNFCEMGGYMAKQVVGAKNTAELNRVLNETSFLARKKDFTDLPAKLPPVTINVDMEGDQLDTYKQMEKLFLAEIIEAGETKRITVDMILSRDIKLRQIMSGWMYDEEGQVETLIEFEKNARFKALIEHLEEQIVGKSVIVCWYKPTIDKMLGALTKRGRNPAFIRGGMTTEEIEEQKRKFNEDDTCLDIVVQEVAAKYGHTLLGTPANPCSSMFFFEQSYSLDDRSQIEDRIHRIGQIWPCSYFDFVAGKLDRACIRALQRKESVAAAILGYARGEFNTSLEDDEAFLRGEMIKDVARYAALGGTGTVIMGT